MPFEFMTSRCYPSIFFHTTNKSTDSLRQHAAVTLAHGGAVLFIDAVDPDGNLDGGVYDRLAIAYQDVKATEPYAGGRLLSHYHVFYSLRSRMDRSVPAHPVAEHDLGVPHLECSKRLLQLCVEHNLPCDVVTDAQLANLAGDDVLLVGDCAVLTSKERTNILAFAKQGGTVYGSGHTLWSLAEDLGLEPAGYHPDHLVYAGTNDTGAAYWGAIDRHNLLQADGRVLLVGNVAPETIGGYLWETYSDPGHSARFASIHTSPPGVRTEHPVFVVIPWGVGRFLLSVLPVERGDMPNSNAALFHMMKTTGPAARYWTSDAPASLETVVRHDEDARRYVVSLVTHQERNPVVVAHDVVVDLQCRQRVTRVYAVPGEEDVDFQQADDRVRIAVPPVALSRLLVVDYAG